MHNSCRPFLSCETPGWSGKRYAEHRSPIDGLSNKIWMLCTSVALSRSSHLQVCLEASLDCRSLTLPCFSLIKSPVVMVLLINDLQPLSKPWSFVERERLVLSDSTPGLSAEVMLYAQYRAGICGRRRLYNLYFVHTRRRQSDLASLKSFAATEKVSRGFETRLYCL